jgi:hypothetical protein
MRTDQLHQDLATIGRNGVDKIIAMRGALLHAKRCILLDRTALADAHMDPRTNRVEDEAVEALAEYDDVLARIDAALDA